MKQIFAHYLKWEDYQNGMYTLDLPIESNILKGVYLLSNEDLFYSVALEVINNWAVSSSVNLTSPSVNKQAWIGQASCCYKYGNNELTTRKSWALLTDIQKYKANNIADKIINIYENKTKRLYSGLGNQMLLQWNT